MKDQWRKADMQNGHNFEKKLGQEILKINLTVKAHLPHNESII